jgi:hypothetical protein
MTGSDIGALKPRGNHSRPLDGFVKSPLKPSSAQRVRDYVKSAEYHKRTQKGQTLMRGGLKKPTQQFHSNLSRLKPGASPERQHRAKQTPRHKNIDRFGVPRPAYKEARHPAANLPVSGELLSAGRSSAPASPIADPLPSMITSVSHQKLERILDEALAKADTHKQALKYHAARHFWQRHWFRGPRRWLMAAAAVAIIGGGLAYSWQRIPQLSVKVASIKAHLSAALPSYKPDGYKMVGPAKAASGEVSMIYKSTAESGASYQINQAQSNLTSSLVAQNVVPKGAAVQTSQVEGNTIYIYGKDNDAAWVNNGVLYTIKDRANLSSDELIKIVHGINQ